MESGRRPARRAAVVDARAAVQAEPAVDAGAANGAAAALPVDAAHRHVAAGPAGRVASVHPAAAVGGATCAVLAELARTDRVAANGLAASGLARRAPRAPPPRTTAARGT